LLLQLLDKSVGDVSIYKILSAIYERAERQSVLEGLEPAMWRALEAAIKIHSHGLTITVDGLDYLQGGEPASLDFCKRLKAIVASHRTMKCILLFRLDDKPCPVEARQFVLDSTYNSDDVRYFVEDSVSSSKEFMNLKEQDKQTIVQKVSRLSAGTFLSADLMLQLLKGEKTLSGILQALETLPKALPDLIQKLSSVVNFKNPDTSLILSSLLVAERPLTLLELKSLVEMDIGSCSHSERFTSIEDDIHNSCGPLVTIRDGVVRFSHHSIKEHLLHLASSGKLPWSIKDAHQRLATRCLAYVKVSLEDWSPEPVFECGWDSIQGKSLADLTKEHHLLEYSTRYWVAHFRKSHMYESKGKYTCTSEFKACFPKSSLLALIEGRWWEVQTSANDAMEMHLLALELRKSILGEKHKSVVQCYINLGRIRRELSDHIKASECYFDAWTISQHISGEKSTVIMACAKAYSEIITRTIVTTHTEFTSRTVQIYKYIWTSHKHTHGAAHEETIKYATYLATLYIQLKELEKAATVYREIHKTCVEKYGHLHELTITITRSLTTVLQRLSKHEECVHICRRTLEVSEETLEVWDERRITATICMFEEYESQKQWHMAEELLLSFRRKLVEICQSSHDDHCHEAKIEITIQYVRFLKRHSREEEAEKILIELWAGVKGFVHGEHRHSETLTIRIRCIGEELKKLKIITVAESVFTSLWEFYKRFTLTTTKEAVCIAVLLSEVYRINMDIHREEIILKEIFEATFTHTHIIETTTITTCVKLGFFYERESRWSEAIDVCHKVLLKLWPHIDVHHPHEYYLPHHHHDDAIMIAHRLALCHHRAGRTEKAESVHIHVFRSCMSSLQLHDERILTTAKYLVGFYESMGMIEKSRAVYYELLEEYRGLLGRHHHLSIKIMYLLAHHCERHEPRGAEHYYLDIVTALHHGSEECDTECIEAMLALCRIYEHDQRFNEAQKLYHRLWLTFRHHGSECGLDTETVMEIYHKYLHILEREHKFTVIYVLAVQYRETCSKYYGARHHYTIQATIELCKILEREESRHEEAMAIYEELCIIVTETHEHSAIIEKIIVEVRERLAHLYSCHTSTTGKAEVIYYESWDKFRCKHGHAHEDTLHRLTELIMFFKKQNTKECKHTATETLQITIIDIVMREKDTQKLFYSAEAIARMYNTLGLEEIAFRLLNEIRRQLTSTKTETSEHFHFSLRQGHTVDRRSFVFVMAFEATLKGEFRASLYAEIMSDLMTETTLFESWMRALKYGGRLEVTLSIGARLRAFLRRKHRQDESEKITIELWELFTAEVGGSTKKSGSLWELFLACLAEMEHEEHHLTLTDAGAIAVISHYDKGDFKGAFELASWIHKFIQGHGDYGTPQNLEVGFKLSLCMAGRNRPKRCQDQELSRKMMELSGSILGQVLKVSEQEHMSFSKMPIHDLNLIVGLLGEQRNFKDLEVLTIPVPSVLISLIRVTYSGFSVIYGTRVKRRIGAYTQPSGLVVVYAKFCSYKIRRKKQSPSAKILATTSNESMEHLTRPLWAASTSCHRFTR
jgi:tetratricopeptide (TPR) repeat protein